LCYTGLEPDEREYLYKKGFNEEPDSKLFVLGGDWCIIFFAK
jgi:hypothetical protein